MSAPILEAERRALDVCAVPLSGVHLIEASAGTGKTYTITSLVLRLVVEQERPIESILAVTFTNAATAELKARVFARIEEARRAVLALSDPSKDPVLARLVALPDQRRVLRLLDVAAQNVDRAGIFTIHGFAARMLADHAFESGAREDTELIGDQRALVQDVVADFWTSRVAVLPGAIFEKIGGSGFFKGLTSVGLQAAAALEVPLVELGPPPHLDEQEKVLLATFERARQAFGKQGEQLRTLLVSSPSLNRNMMKVLSLDRDYQDFFAYFAAGDARFGHPETERWTQTKVNAAIKKNQPSVQHDLLGVLEELRQAHAQFDSAVRRFRDELRAELCRSVHERVQKEHERAGTQSFDGLLTDLCAALRDEERGPRLAAQVRRLLPVALIDEFQDTDPVQYEIFHRLYVPENFTSSDTTGPCSLYLIGDPKQSIYAFRGADVRTYLEAASQASGGIWTLGTSYRASPRLVAAQNALFQNTQDAFCVPGIGYQQVDARPGAVDVLTDKEGEPLPGIKLAYCSRMDKDAWLWWTASEVARFLSAGHLLEGRPVSPRNVAVLTRTNRQAQEVQAMLRRLGIPAVMHGDRSVLESPEAFELRRVLLALAEPGHRTLVRTALATRMLGLNADELLALDDDHETLEAWTGRLRTLSERWRSQGVAHALEALSAETDFVARTLSDRDGERRMTNFRHLLELLHEAQTKQHLGVAGLIRYFDGAISDPSGHAMAAEARQLRLESDADAVTLTTAHKSKGLEYDVVFLPAIGLDERKRTDEAFRYFDNKAEKTLFEMRTRDSRDGSEEIHTLESRQESLRLGYVALTRAKHHVFALCGPGTHFSALHYLLHERDSGKPGGMLGLTERLKTLSVDARKSDLDRLAEESAGAVQWALMDEALGPVYSRERDSAALVPPSEAPTLRESERTSSFSAMTRDNHRQLSRDAQEGRDIDEVADGEVGPHPAASGDSRGLAQRVVLADFPRGAGPGDALHALYEFSPFREGNREDRRVIVERELRKRNFDLRHLDSACQSLEDVLATEFGAEHAERPIRLGALDRKSRAPEMEFSLPIAQLAHRLSAARLARALGHVDLPPNAPELEESVDPPTAILRGRYLARLSQLSFAAWSGFLRGFMDLVFVWEGRIHGLDYKSNFLGEHYSDYLAPALRGAMEEHHYLLQAFLYAVAIHRYGQTRIAGYSYAKHFGGMHYLFLRGMHPAHPGNGVCSFRPDETLIEELSRVLTEGK